MGDAPGPGRQPDRSEQLTADLHSIANGTAIITQAERKTMRSAAGEIERLLDEIQRLRAALRTLEAWDMLTLTSDGRGMATHDAPWARKLIANALRGPDA